MRAWASDGGWRRAVRLVNRALKMMCKVLLGLGHMRGCAERIWGGSGMSRWGRAHQRSGDVFMWSRVHLKGPAAHLKGPGCVQRGWDTCRGARAWGV